PHPRACSSFGLCLHEPVRHALPDTDEASQVPYKGRLYVHGVSDCARLLHPQAICAGRMLPSRQRTRSAPRNSTRFAARYPARGLPCERFTAALASRNLVHHSGPGRLARPYPVEDLHLLSFASFPGALGSGSDSVIRRCQLQCLLCPKADTAGRFMSTHPNLILVVDVRGPNAFGKGHVKGAINIPHREMTATRMAEYPKDKVFVVYCADPHCNGANKAALR